jgi:hypothetical protein
MYRQLLSLSLVALGLVSWAESEAQPPTDSVCPTCALPEAEGGAADGGGTASQIQCAAQAPLTSKIADELQLETLRAYLERSNSVAGHFGAETAPPDEQGATVELEFDVGDFSYYEKTPDAEIGCDDSVRAPAHVAVRIDDGLLSFEADGLLWKGRHEPSAHFYADTNLAMVTGSYRLPIDLARPHVGKISVSLYASPGHLRGGIDAAVAYLRDEAELQRYRQDDWSAFFARPVAFPFRLAFPDDACEDGELPFAHDEAIEPLARRSADEWRARAVDLIASTTRADAVWDDGRETEVAVELGEPVGGTVCLGASFNPLARASELALTVPLAGRLRSADARLDMPLSALMVYIDAGVVVGATMGDRPPITAVSERQREALGASADLLLARLDYDFAREPASLNGMVELLARTEPNSYTRVGCVAFPRGGKSDKGSCRYVFAPPSTATTPVNRP